MSRAFITEGDGWEHCVSRDRDCMFGDGQGGCMLRVCRYDGKPTQKSEQPPQSEK